MNKSNFISRGGATAGISGSFCGDLGIGPFIIDPENGIFRVAPCFQDTLTIIYISFFIIILGGCLVASRNTNHISSGTLDHSSLDKDEEPVNQSFSIRIIYLFRLLASGLFLILFLTMLGVAFAFPDSSLVFLQESLVDTKVTLSNLITLILSVGLGLATLVLVSNKSRKDIVAFILATGYIGLFLIHCIRLRSMLYILDMTHNQLSLTLFVIIMFSELLIIIMCSFPIYNRTFIMKTEKGSPEIHANYFSRLFFGWVFPFLWKGYKTPLELEDVYDLNPNMTSAFLHGQLMNAWRVQLSKLKGLAPSKPMFLVNVLISAFGWEYLCAGIMKIVMICFTYLSPQLMTMLLEYLESQVPPPPQIAPFVEYRPEPKSNGLFIVIVMITIMIVNIAMGAMFSWLCDMATYKARSALMNQVFQKSLRLKTPMDPGEVINRFSADTGSVTGAFAYLHLLWSAPIEIAVCLYLLYGILGPSSFAALGTSLVIGLTSLVVVPYVVKKTNEMFQINDQRMNLVAGTFSSIQTIKLFGWENVFREKITNVRNTQLDKLGQIMVITSIIGGVMSSAVNLIILSTLAIYALTAPPDRPLDLARIFVGMTLLGTLQSPLNTLSGMYSQIMSLSVSYNRLCALLFAPEVMSISPPPAPVQFKRRSSTFKSKKGMMLDPSRMPSDQGPCISVRNASFKTVPAPPQNNNPNMPPPDLKGKGNLPMPMIPTSKLLLDRITLDIPKGKLTTIIGPTGSGKTCLLSVLAGSHSFDQSPRSTVSKIGKSVLAAQNPWLFHGTGRDNILFYSEYNPLWYRKVVKACCLDVDFEHFPGKDMTILDDGSNLSGGQRQRISLARAVYSQSDIYLFDDPLSAVDVRVGGHIFRHVVSNDGLLKEKTRVFVTNRTDLIQESDHIVVIVGGSIVAQGSYDFVLDFVTGKPDLERLLNPTVDLSPKEEAKMVLVTSKQKLDPLRKKILEFKSYQLPTSKTTRRRRTESTIEQTRRVIRMSSNGSVGRCNGGSIASEAILTLSAEQEDLLNARNGQEMRMVKDEMVQRGRLSYNLYWYYIQNCSYLYASMVILLLFAVLGLGSWNEFWLQSWGQSNIYTTTKAESVKNNMWYLGIFTAGTIGATILGITLDLIAIRVMALQASRTLHRKVLASTLAAPLSFFYANPAGRIINRFSNDILDLDQTIPSNLLAFINSLLSAVLSIALACIASYYVVFIAVVMLIVYWFLLNFFMATVRELRRLVLTTQSPTLSFLKESLDGVLTIRAYGKEMELSKKMEMLIDINSKVFYSTFAASSWLSTCIQVLSLSMTIPVLLLTIMNSGNSTGFLAVALTNSLSISGTLQGIVQAYISIEISLVSIERIKEYVELPSEKQFRDPRILPMPYTTEWPTNGEIQFSDYSAKYDASQPEFILKDLNFTIPPGAKVAIVGRTGAGKSTLALALFQLLGEQSGFIFIDGMDLGKMTLDMLRSRLAIIPQNPMIFPGSVRENLDPTLMYSDRELWGALELTEMSDQIKKFTGGNLDAPFPGDQMSMGQRQLFCLSRAVLKKSKIVVLDEPSANIDPQTDYQLQKMIRTVFSGCTVITIAHRLSTIIDYDSVVVLDKGYAVEMGNPKQLLKNPKSVFFKMTME